MTGSWKSHAERCARVRGGVVARRYCARAVQGSPVLAIAVFKQIMMRVLAHTDCAAAWAALPANVDLLPAPLIPRGPIVPALSPTQVSNLLVPIMKLLTHMYSDVVLEGVTCACNLTEQPANLMYMRSMAEFGTALTGVLCDPKLIDSAVLAALTLSRLADGTLDGAAYVYTALASTPCAWAVLAANCALRGPDESLEQQCLRTFCLRVVCSLVNVSTPLLRELDAQQLFPALQALVMSTPLDVVRTLPTVFQHNLLNANSAMQFVRPFAMTAPLQATPKYHVATFCKVRAAVMDRTTLFRRLVALLEHHACPWTFEEPFLVRLRVQHSRALAVHDLPHADHDGNMDCGRLFEAPH